MAEQRLDASQVGAIREQVRRKGVTNDVRRHLARDTAFRRILLHNALDRARRKASQVFTLLFIDRAVADKQRVSEIPALLQIVGDSFFRSRGEKYDAHFIS